MTCANWMLTILSAAILIVTIWPAWFGATANKWIVIIAAILILIIVWTAVDCRMCNSMKPEKPQTKKKK